MDVVTKKAIYHLLSLWRQYSSSVGKDGNVYYEHHCMSAGENAGDFLMSLGLGTEDGYGLSLNEQRRTIAEDESLAAD